MFLVSGFIGLGVGDMFLLFAFTRIGPSRTLMLWGFQPVFIGIGSYFFLHQPIGLAKAMAILFLIGCLLTFSYERYRKDGHWEVLGLIFAILGVLLDAVGIFLTREGFNTTPNIHVLEGHFYRCLGALICFGLISFRQPLGLLKNFLALPSRDKGTVVSGSLMGTFLSLLFALSAIRVGHLPSLAALACTNPIFSAIFEHVHRRKKPELSFILAIILFLAGFTLLVVS